jgi:hypothetical protein
MQKGQGFLLDLAPQRHPSEAFPGDNFILIFQADRLCGGATAGTCARIGETARQNTCFRGRRPPWRFPRIDGAGNLSLTDGRLFLPSPCWRSFSESAEPPMDSPIDEFDLNAAIARRSERDLRAFMAALATRLETALPNRVAVERKRDGFLSTSSHVARLKVEFSDAIFTLALTKQEFVATRAKVVRAVAISTATLPAAEWLAELKAALAKVADRDAGAGDILRGFL